MASPPGVIPLSTIAKVVTVQALLDLRGNTSSDLAKHLCKCLASHHFTAVSDELLRFIVEYYPLKLTDDLLVALTAPHMRVLKLTGCEQLTFSGLQRALACCRKLESLDISSCDELVRPECLKLYILLAPKISSLCLQSCSALTDAGVQTLLEFGKSLSHLDVSLCESLTDNAFLLDEDTQTSRVRGNDRYSCRLRSVDLSGCRQLTTTTAYNLVTLCGPSLESVNLTFTAVDHMALIYLSGYDFMHSPTQFPVPGPYDTVHLLKLLAAVPDEYKECWVEPSASVVSPGKESSTDDKGQYVKEKKKAEVKDRHEDQPDATISCDNAEADGSCCYNSKNSPDGEAVVMVKDGKNAAGVDEEKQLLLTDAELVTVSQKDESVIEECSAACTSKSEFDEDGLENKASNNHKALSRLNLVEHQMQFTPRGIEPEIEDTCTNTSVSVKFTDDQQPGSSQLTSPSSTEILPGMFMLNEEDLASHVPSASSKSTPEHEETNAEAKDESFEQKNVVLKRIYKPCLRSFELSDYYGQLFPCGSNISTECWRFFIKAQRRLDQLCIWWAAGEICALNDIAKLSPGITYLCLEGSEAVSTMNLREVTLQCRNLKSLQIRGLAFVGDAAVLPVTKRGEVTSLNVSETSITDVTLQSLARDCAAQLEELHLDCCEEITETGLGLVASSCSKLRNLSLRQCPISSASLRNLARSCPLITHLDLSSVNTVDNDVLVAIAMKMNRLQNFDISWNVEVTDVGILAVMQFCSQLRHLNLAGLKQVTSEPFVPIISDPKEWVRSQSLLKYKVLEKKMREKEEEVSDSDEEEMDEFVLPSRSTTYVPLLQRLDLEYVDRVHDDHLAQIVAVCRGSIKIRNYYGCDLAPHLIPTIKGDLYLAKF